MPSVSEILDSIDADTLATEDVPAALLCFAAWPNVDEFGDFETGAVHHGSIEERSFDQAGVEWIRKRKDGTFPNLIGLGRTRNNDIVIPLPNISKYHAYFQFDTTGAFVVADAGSKNGTKLNGRPMATRVPQPVEHGDHLSFGGHDCTFYRSLRFLREARVLLGVDMHGV